jgi:hypothetical protein
VKFSKKIQNLIANFRGLPEDSSPSILKDEWPAAQLFRDILKKYVTKSDVEIGAEIFENWPRIVGDMFCNLCAPHKITATGALVLKVQNSVVRQELFLRKKEILQHIYQSCPRCAIRDIVFSL